MKETELRIGSIIADFDCEPYYFAIESIYCNAQGKYRCNYRNGSVDCAVEHLVPQEITHDLLVKLGLYHRVISGVSLYEDQRTREELVGLVISKGDKGYRVYRFYNDEYIPLTYVSYIHEVQNLHLDINKTELKLQ